MPLTDSQKLELKAEAMKVERDAIVAYIKRIQDVLAEDAAPGERSRFTLAVGALWYGMLGGCRQMRGERATIELDVSANVIASTVVPDLVNPEEAVQRVLDYQQMADPTAKG